MAFAAVGVLLARQRAALGLLCVLYTSGLTIIFQGDARYHYWLIPLLAIYAAYALVVAATPYQLRRRVRNSRRLQVAAANPPV